MKKWDEIRTLDDLTRKEIKKIKKPSQWSTLDSDIKIIIYGAIIVTTLAFGYKIYKDSGYQLCKPEEVKQNLEMMYK